MINRIADFARKLRSVPTNADKIPLLLAQSENIERRIAALDQAVRALGPQETLALPAKSGSYDALAEHLRHVLAQPVRVEGIECPCCKSPIVFADAKRRVAKCMFSGVPLERYECAECGLIFGPLQFLFGDPEWLAKAYTLLYEVYSEGDTRPAQEKTFYLLNPALGKRYLNYACGDWDEGIGRLRALGWDVSGYEPFQVNQSEWIFADSAKLGEGCFDGIFTNNYIEHIRDLPEFFDLMSKLTVPGGSMAHTTPCYRYVYEGSPSPRALEEPSADVRRGSWSRSIPTRVGEPKNCLSEPIQSASARNPAKKWWNSAESGSGEPPGANAGANQSRSARSKRPASARQS